MRVSRIVTCWLDCFTASDQLHHHLALAFHVHVRLPHQVDEDDAILASSSAIRTASSFSRFWDQNTNHTTRAVGSPNCTTI